MKSKVVVKTIIQWKQKNLTVLLDCILNHNIKWFFRYMYIKSCVNWKNKI